MTDEEIKDQFVWPTPALTSSVGSQTAGGGGGSRSTTNLYKHLRGDDLPAPQEGNSVVGSGATAGDGGLRKRPFKHQQSLPVGASPPPHTAAAREMAYPLTNGGIGEFASPHTAILIAIFWYKTLAIT